jgi:tRNA (guanine10-N2)-methyltransferase
VELPSEDAAVRLAKRSILVQSIHEYWGSGKTLDELHDVVRTKTQGLWSRFENCSFRFDIECFQGTRPNKMRREIIESFGFLPFNGRILMKDPDETFTIFEVWDPPRPDVELLQPLSMHLGRFLATSARGLISKFDLKKRSYIATTSMESELSLITANIALAARGKLFYDPFVGTGSFPIACANFGAICWGSDIDGRSMRGEGGKRSLKGNFDQYGLLSGFGNCFSADLTHSPVARRQLWDGIVCDIPYGVREGLKVLGLKNPDKTPWLVEKGIREHM